MNPEQNFLEKQQDKPREFLVNEEVMKKMENAEVVKEAEIKREVADRENQNDPGFYLTKGLSG